MKSCKEYSINSLQKLNPCYILLSAIYRPFTMLLSSQRLIILIYPLCPFNRLVP